MSYLTDVVDISEQENLFLLFTYNIEMPSSKNMFVLKPNQVLNA